jgi:hypothetical protein
MLKANVGLSRKLSKDYNSTGYSINLDGEIVAPVSDPEAVIEQIKELFDLAEEALSQQIERAESISAIASRDDEPKPPAMVHRNGNGINRGGRLPEAARSDTRLANSGDRPQEEQPATNKQIQYLLSIGKRQKMSTMQLEKRVAEILGRPVEIYSLSKQAAGVVIEALSNGAATNGACTRR